MILTKLTTQGRSTDWWIVSTGTLLQAILDWETQEAWDVHGPQSYPSYMRALAWDTLSFPGTWKFLLPLVACLGTWKPIFPHVLATEQHASIYLINPPYRGDREARAGALISSSLMCSFTWLRCVSNFVNGTLAVRRSVTTPWFPFCESLSGYFPLSLKVWAKVSSIRKMDTCLLLWNIVRGFWAWIHFFTLFPGHMVLMVVHLYIALTFCMSHLEMSLYLT